MDSGKIIATLREFVGVPPMGYEWLEYGMAVIFTLFLFQFLFDWIRNISKAFWR